MSYTVVTDNPTYPGNNPYQIISLTENILLSWSSSFISGQVAANINKVIPTQANFTITLPDATLAAPGTSIVFYNPSIYTFDILQNDGLGIINVGTGQAVNLVLSDNSTSGGDWDVFPFGNGTTNITTFTVTSSNESINVTNGTVNAPTGTIDLKLSPSLTDLSLLNETGMVFITNTNPFTWDVGNIIGGSNITIADSGHLGNLPTVSLNTDISGLTSLQVGDFYFTGSTLAADSSDVDLNFSTAGTGVLNLNGVTIDASGNLTASGGMTSSFLPSFFTTFTDTITGLTNTIVQQDSGNAASITGSAGTYVLTFTNPLNTTTYGVFFGFGSTGDPTPLIYNGVVMVKETTSVTISVTNMSGALITDAPYGISVMIMGGN